MDTKEADGILTRFREKTRAAERQFLKPRKLSLSRGGMLSLAESCLKMDTREYAELSHVPDTMEVFGVKVVVDTSLKPGEYFLLSDKQWFRWEGDRWAFSHLSDVGKLRLAFNPLEPLPHA